MRSFIIVICLIIIVVVVGCTPDSPEELLGKWEKQDNSGNQFGIIFYKDGSAEMFRVGNFDNKIFKKSLIEDSLKLELYHYNSRIPRNNIKYRTIGTKDSLALILDFYKNNVDTPFYSFPLGILHIQSENEFWLYENRWHGYHYKEVLKNIDYLKLLHEAYMANEKSYKNIDADMRKTNKKLRDILNKIISDNYSVELNEAFDKLNISKSDLNIYQESYNYIDSLNISDNKKINFDDSTSISKLFLAIDIYEQINKKALDKLIYYKPSLRPLRYPARNLLRIESNRRKYYLIKGIDDTHSVNIELVKSYLSKNIDLYKESIAFLHDYKNLNYLIFGQGYDPRPQIFRKGI